MKRALIMAFVWGLVALGVTLLLKSENLPFDSYLYRSPILTAVYGLLNLPMLLVLFVTNIDYRPFALSLIFIQWSMIGFFVTWIFRRRRR